MTFENAIVYNLPISREKMYIRGLFQALDIKKFYEKEVAKMDFDVEKLKAYYADLLAKREEAVAVALADKERVVAERFELAREELAKQVEAELVAAAEEPYKHDIELCESFGIELPEENVEGEVVEGE